MSRPRLLDLFCGAGGASVGYHRAGFDVVGVDINPQPRYPFEFHRADAMTFPLDGFDVIHASPPCQGYSVTRTIPGRDFSSYPLLIDPVRDRLRTEVPDAVWVIENAETAPLVNPLLLCGSMFGLRVRRHRLFESNRPIYWPPATCNHSLRVKAAGQGKRLAYYTRESDSGLVTVAGHLFSLGAGRSAMGIDWMTRDELAESIPPAYTAYIGGRLLAVLRMTPRRVNHASAELRRQMAEQELRS